MVLSRDVTRAMVYVFKDVTIERPSDGMLPLRHVRPSGNGLYQRGQLDQVMSGLHIQPGLVEAVSYTHLRAHETSAHL
eukprot:12722506-Alexandrium_andersonii.AAC.1